MFTSRTGKLLRGFEPVYQEKLCIDLKTFCNAFPFHIVFDKEVQKYYLPDYLLVLSTCTVKKNIYIYLDQPPKKYFVSKFVWFYQLKKTTFVETKYMIHAVIFDYFQTYISSCNIFLSTQLIFALWLNLINRFIPSRFFTLELSIQISSIGLQAIKLFPVNQYRV